MSHPRPYTRPHEIDSTLETNSIKTKQMKTVIKNSAQDPCLDPSRMSGRFNDSTFQPSCPASQTQSNQIQPPLPPLQRSMFDVGCFSRWLLTPKPTKTHLFMSSCDKGKETACRPQSTLRSALGDGGSFRRRRA
jgi:hypothetical protein